MAYHIMMKSFPAIKIVIVLEARAMQLRNMRMQMTMSLILKNRMVRRMLMVTLRNLAKVSLPVATNANGLMAKHRCSNNSR